MIEPLVPPTFPVEAVPDGRALAPHHYLYPLVACVIIGWRVGDEEPHSEPWLLMGGSLAGAFAFVSVWPSYPKIGAVLAGVALLAAMGGLLRPTWGRVWPRRQRVACALLLAVSADDWISHALGWPTLLDRLWRELGPAYATVALAGAAVVGAVALKSIPEPRPAGQ